MVSLMSSEREIVIRARHLSKAYPLYNNQNLRLKQGLFGAFKTYYKPFWALRDIDLDIARGDSVGILGRNGSGKSTLLKIICGMIKPTKGDLQVTGRVAPVFALGATFDWESTGRANVLIAGAVMGLKRREVMSRFDSISEFAGIGDFMDQPLKHYSSGMKARLAFAICAHADAEILIIDEALAVGDEAFQRNCTDWIDRFRATGTLLFVSHSPAEVARLCRHAIWIENGRVRAHGEPDSVIESYTRASFDEQEDVRRFSATVE